MAGNPFGLEGGENRNVNTGLDAEKELSNDAMDLDVPELIICAAMDTTSTPPSSIGVRI